MRVVLEKLGLLNEYDRVFDIPCHLIRSVWAEPVPTDKSSMFHPLGAGRMVDRGVFDKWLRDCAQKRGVCVWNESFLRAVSRRQNIFGLRDLEVQRGDETASISARLVVDGTGRASVARRFWNARRRIVRRMAAILFLAQPASPVSLTVESTAGGWWSAMCLGQAPSLVTFYTPVELLAQHRSQMSQFIGENLAETSAISPLVRAGSWAGNRQIKEAGTSYLNPMAGDGWLACGDSAVRYDPLCGQGVFRAMLGGLRAGEAGSDYLAGSVASFGPYEKQCLAELHTVQARLQMIYGLETRWGSNNAEEHIGPE